MHSFLGGQVKGLLSKSCFSIRKNPGGFANNTLIVEYACFTLLQLKPGLLARRACVTCLHVFHMVISAVLLLTICSVVPTYYFSHCIGALLQDPNIIYGYVYI